jgi:hypothetical protein
LKKGESNARGQRGIYKKDIFLACRNDGNILIFIMIPYLELRLNRFVASGRE